MESHEEKGSSESMEKNFDLDVIRFPWRRDGSYHGNRPLPEDMPKPGEFILQNLFLEFCSIAEKKIDQVLAEPLEKSLSKSLQRGEDAVFDQILSSLGSVAEQSLPSILRSLFRWFEKQNLLEEYAQPSARQRHRSRGSKDFLCERRDLAVEFVYCLALIEVLAKLNFHPGHDDLVAYIIKQAFKHFKYRDTIQTNPNSGNISLLADLYAEVIGVLALSRFQAVKQHFMSELRELKLRDTTPYTAQSIISLMTSIKYFKVKMHPIEDFEACIQFLHDLGHYFMEVKDKDIKHALATLFIDILLPVAATAKNEVNVPVLKNLVDMLYTYSIDLTQKKKHIYHLFPLVTVLLCVSQKQFFLTNWPFFLTSCLSNLRSKDQKLTRMSLDSLHRLLWVYMVRIKCESNTATNSRLQSIVSSLFPKGSKMVMPRDVPLNYFVKIIHFIAKERLDFAMKEIIFDLLCVGRQAKILHITPERMSIGLRAFLVIADSLQQRDGDPPMPQTQVALPSGCTVRVKRTFLNKMLNESTAKNIGLSQYYPHILKAFDAVLRALDLQVGRQLLMTKSENVNKEPDDLLTAERKSKIELFRTCVAAIPRLIPDGMKELELVELLTRLTVHFDEELKGHAFQALQNLMQESPSWRENVIRGFVEFVQKEISDTSTQILDGSLRLLMQLLVQWKNIITSPQLKEKSGDIVIAKTDTTELLVLRDVEGLALVMLCSCRVVTRKLAAHLLKEARNIVNACCTQQVYEPCLLDIIDKGSPDIIKKLLPQLPATEKTVILTSPNMDLSWVIERAVSVWNPNTGKEINLEERSESFFCKVDPWMQFLAMIASNDYGQTLCSDAIHTAWPIVFTRLNNLYTLLDPSNMINDYRGSYLLRPGQSSKKPTTERDVHIQLWQNYVILACVMSQKETISPFRCASPDPGSSPESEKSDNRSSSNCTAANLFKLLVPLIKCDNVDMKTTIVNGLGYTNPASFKDLLDELSPYLKEAIERKQENIRRRRKKDMLRKQLANIFALLAINKTFSQPDSGVIDVNSKCLIKPFVEYIDGARQNLESDSDRDLPVLLDMRLYFSKFVRELISNTSSEFKRSLLTRDLRYSLFHLFASWSGKFSHTIGDTLDRRLTKEENCSELELAAVRAMSAVLCCGPVFDQSGLNDDGYIYQWLDMLLSSHDDRIYDLAKETVVLLLDFNPDTQVLLDWVIDRCYTGANEVADGCFNALAAVFQSREYPCDHVSMLNLAVLNVGNPRMPTHETAIHLLHLLDTRFFQETPVITDASEEQPHQNAPINDILLSVSYCHSQHYLSEQLAKLHPDLTMPMFSEITHRFQTAKASVRQSLLKYILPWLHNMELVDPSLPQSSPLSTFLTRLHETQTETFKPPLKGEGWGSPEATKMVLNNLFYITVKFGDDHPREIEECWSSLVVCWPNNLKVVIHYLVIITNMAASELLQYAKRVVVYLGRARPERLVDELMNELQTVETLNMNIERTQTPPFFRLSQLKKNVVAINTTDDEKLDTLAPLEKGTLHTKRHSANEELRGESTPRTESTTSLRSVSSTSSNPDQFLIDEDLHLSSGTRAVDGRVGEGPVPYPLPMPAYGGYFAPLTEYLPETLHPTSGFHRSNIAVMFLSDLVLDGLEIDWSAHLPLMLHVIFLGLDHTRGMVYEHCKKLLENLMLLAAQDHPSVCRLLLEYRSNITDTLTLIAADDNIIPSSLDAHDSNEAVARSTFSVDSGQTLTTDISTPIEPPSDPESLNTVEEIIKAILDFMEARRGRPLWSYEDITPRTLNTQSAVQLDYFLQCVTKCFKEMSPLALVEQRWTQVALQLALSCSSRHYAGRSFQVLRALHIRPSTQIMSDILSRLVETVAEQGEDMQGYVTEIILTLEAAVDNLDFEFRPTDFMRELFKSTPNLAKEGALLENRKSSVLMAPRAQHHTRSTSYSVASSHRSPLDLRLRSSTDFDGRMRSNMPRSRSAHSLKNLDPAGTEDKLTIMSQMLWIAISLLESDYEYEFSLAIKLISKILNHIQPERPECRERLEKIQQQTKWTNFPGIQALLLKGFTSANLSDTTWGLLSRLTICISAPIVDPSENLGFPMNVVALLPVLVNNYEKANQKCRDAADHIAQVCSQKSDRLNNLATVMSLYSRGTFGKDSFQWTKCVVKYLLDVYCMASFGILSYLVEVLEKGPASYHDSVFQIIHCIVHYLDVMSSSACQLNSELFLTLTKHVETSHWKESLKILKLAVAKSSTLTAAPPSVSADTSMGLLTSHTSFAEAEIITKKELPGRTLEFVVDMKQVSLIGRKFVNTEVHGPIGPAVAASSSPVKKGTGNSEDSVFRKPHASQARVREKLADLLTCYGQKRLPKSPSDTIINKVIFSQSSDTLDHQQSVASSGEETSIPDATTSDILLSEPNVNDINLTIKGFDFLDNELEDSDDDSFYNSTLDRRRSYNTGSPDHDRSERQIHYGSVPDLKLLGNHALSEKPITPSDSVSLKEVPTSDNESETQEDICQNLPKGTTITIQNPMRPERRGSNSSPSINSDTDILELSSNATSPGFPQMSETYLYLTLQSDEVEDVWKDHVTKVMAGSSASLSLSTSQIFPRLYKELRRRLDTMTKEASYYIAKTESLKHIAVSFKLLDMMFNHLECPYFYTESDTLSGSRVIEGHKFSLLEMEESFENYRMRKNQTEESLEAIKSSIKQQSLGDGDNFVAGCSDEQKHELCKKLYRLIFQLVQLFENYTKLMDIFNSAKSLPQVSDISEEVLELKGNLCQTLNDMENGQDSPLNIDSGKPVCKNEAFLSLAEYIEGQHYAKAIHLLRAYRALWPNDVFGQGIEDDIIALLNVYCNLQAEKNNGIFALVGLDKDGLGQVHSQLMTINIQLSGWSSAPNTTARLEPSQSPDSSSL